MSGFGSSDIVQDQSGNALANVKLNVYGALSDAKAQTNLLATVTTNSLGQWPVTVNGYDMVWVRDPAGNIWSAASDTVAGDHASRLAALEGATSSYQPVSTFDATQAGNINNTGSQSRTALNALYGSLSMVTLLQNSMINVKDPQWGLVADYNPNTNTGTDNLAKLNAVFASAIASGKWVYFPDGHYGVNGQPTISTAATLNVCGAPSSIVGGVTNMHGAWLHYMGSSTGGFLTLADCQNVNWFGVGLNLRSQCDGFTITSDNAPISTRMRFAWFNVWNPNIGFNINTGGAGTQSDQMLFEGIRMDGFVTCAYQTNSSNVTACHWIKCTTAAASTTAGTHFNFIRGGMLVIENCTAGYGQVFCNVGLNASCITLDTCQMEGSTSGSRAFLIVGANGDVGETDTVVMRNCTPDNPVILAGPSRKILSQGNLWHSGANITVSGASSRFLSYGEDVSAATITVSGTNAMFRQMDADLINGGNPITASAGANGSTAVTVTGNTYAGTIAFTTSASLAADAYALVIGITSQIGTGYRVSLTPTNGAAAAAQAFVSGKLSSQWELHLHNPPASATAMTFDYRLG